MNRTKGILDCIQVKSPCTEDWTEMVGNDEVRFCSHCRKHVHNLSAMTRREAEELVLRSSGNLCIRYLRRPEDQQIVTLPDWMDRPALRRIALPIAAGVMAVVLNTSPVFAQEPAQTSFQIVQPQSDSSAPRKFSTKLEGERVVRGTVQDTSGATITGAEVRLININSGEIQLSQSDKLGRFQFDTVTEGHYLLKVSAVGFMGLEVEGLEVTSTQGIEVNPALEVGEMGGFIITTDTLVDTETQAELQTEMALDETKTESILVQQVETGDKSAVLGLLKQGVNPDARNEFGETALMLVGNSKTIAKYLVRYGADVNARNQVGATPLMYAMLQDKAFIPKLLIAGGADVNAADQSGRTALMIAAFEGKTRFIELLIKAGADIEAKDQFGKTALDYAMDAEQKEAAKILTFAKWLSSDVSFIIPAKNP
ncbi:MAG: ankyrin repeat domain-containing protein [Acidobacteria bacterium]|nr:ankyrin repeat domain-containing protein [Acidobacteriota bacterium]